MKKQKTQKKQKSFTPYYDLPRKKKKAALKYIHKIYEWGCIKNDFNDIKEW